MIYTLRIQKATNLAIKTHEVDQKQKRKGKDVPYITHPLSVGLILANTGATEDVVVAGILHDTIEDSVAEHKVTKEMITDMFGQRVSELVLSVTEQDKSLSWEKRKAEALEHIKTFSNDSLLLKSADIISNTSELIADYRMDGEKTFDRFNAPKERILQNYLRTITAIIMRWENSPLKNDLIYIAGQLQMMGAGYFMTNYSAPIIEYKNYNDKMELECPICDWKGLGEVNSDSHFCLDVSCPICDKMLLVVNYPLVN